MQRVLQTAWGRYALAIAAVAGALAIRALIDPLVGRGAATVTLYGAIVLAVWAGGYRPGILAALLGYLGVNFFFIEPRGSISLENLADFGRLLGFTLSSVLIIALGGAMHGSRQRAEREAQAARRHAQDLEREVAGHRQTRASLEAKEHDLQTITDTMSVAVARCSADLRYLWVNRLYAEWVGQRKPEEMIGRPMFEILGLEAVEQIRPHIDQVLGGRRVEYERFARRPLLGRRRWVHVILEPTFEEAVDGSRKVSGWVSVIHDIDERKRAVEGLRDAQEQLQLITDTMSAAVARTGNDLRFVWMNPVYARWVGKSEKQLVGQGIAEALGPEQMRDIAPHVARVLKGESVQYERLADLPGLGKRWISCIYTPVLDATGHPDGWVTIATDVHDRKLAEDSLKAADRRKDDFLATLAHELRNPLAPIRNAAAILARKGPLDPELTWIVRQVEQMSRLIEDLLDAERISRGKASPRKAPRPSASLRILVADDNQDAADSLRRVLELYGHKVEVAYDGESAIRLGASFEPEIAVLDIGMPEVSGYDAARSLRVCLGQRVALVALTGWGQEGDRRRATEAGFDYHLTKPVDPEKLNDLVAGVAQRASPAPRAAVEGK